MGPCLGAASWVAAGVAAPLPPPTPFRSPLPLPNPSPFTVNKKIPMVTWK